MRTPTFLRPEVIAAMFLLALALARPVNAQAVFVPPTTAATLPSDYISGFELEYDSTNVIEAKSGSAYVPSASAVVTDTTAPTNTPSLSASTLYYVYLNSSGALVVSATAPSTVGYRGTASEDSSGDRYLGSFLTDGSSNIINFRRSGSLVLYKAATNASPFLLLSAGNATSSTSVSCSSIVPATSNLMDAMVWGEDAGLQVSFGTSDSVSNIWSQMTGGVGSGPLDHAMELNATQAFTYKASSSSNEIFVACLGYWEDR